MTNQELRRSQRSKLTARYRGGFICRQKDGFKLITMIVSLLTPDEQSTVTTCDCGFTFTEEAKHIPLGSLLVAVDLYQFAVTDGTEIELTVRGSQGEYRARYIVCPTDRQTRTLTIPLARPCEVTSEWKDDQTT